MENMEIWNKVKQPPKEALKQIGAGRLRGMTDVSPQWRYQVMTEVFGPCGTGWKFDIVRLWSEDGADGVKFAFAHVNLHYINPENNSWNGPVPGIGGSTLVAKESKGLYSSDEGYKMAVTDALSVAMKSLGVAADIYAGKWDGSKYADAKEAPHEKPSEPIEPPMTKEQKNQLLKLLVDAGKKELGDKLTVADAKEWGVYGATESSAKAALEELNRRFAEEDSNAH